MEDLKVGFCSECSDQIISRTLSVFWKCVCMATITDGKWSAFYVTDLVAERYIKLLEKKHYIISTDHEDLVMIRPVGVFKRSDNSYIVCLDHENHFD